MLTNTSVEFATFSIAPDHLASQAVLLFRRRSAYRGLASMHHLAGFQFRPGANSNRAAVCLYIWIFDWESTRMNTSTKGKLQEILDI
jgi:hypothetical protein